MKPTCQNYKKIWQVSAFTSESWLKTKCVKKLGMTDRPNAMKKNWVCKVLPTYWIPAEWHVRLKSSTMTESLLYGRLPLTQARADLNIKNDGLHLMRLTMYSFLSSFLRAVLEATWQRKVEVSLPPLPITK